MLPANYPASKSIVRYCASQSGSSHVTGGSIYGSKEQITPINFDKFIPWMCVELGVSKSVSVMKMVQEDIIQVKVTPKTRSLVINSNEKKPEANKSDEHDDALTSATIQIYAYYDSKNRLVEIRINKCPLTIPRKVFVAINLCIPFHPMLAQLTIHGGLNYLTIQEINKLLPYSNITNICLDDSFVPQGNYYILLQETSQLNYLSLKRCKINDEVCKRIALNLMYGKPAAITLRALELTSNKITDTGVEYLATMLRANRCLMHLNLAGNQITDKGGILLLNTLMEFRLTDDELLDMKRRKLRFLENKQSVYNKCLEELMQQMENIKPVSPGTLETIKPVSMATSGKSLTSKKSKRSTAVSTPTLKRSKPKESAEIMARGIVGEFVDPFDSKNVQIIDGHYYSKGNFVLCSLNLAYNDLHYLSLQKLDEVVTYQIVKAQTVPNMPDADGLLRIVIDGNFMPEKCDEFDRIEYYLRAKRVRRVNESKRLTSASSAKSKFRSARPTVSSKKSQVAFDK